MSAMPGQRTIILASPGFITTYESSPTRPISWTAPSGPTSSSAPWMRAVCGPIPRSTPAGPAAVNAYIGQVKADYDRDAARAQADVLAELAVGTGGKFFENNNDLDARASKRSAAAPEYFYMLGLFAAESETRWQLSRPEGHSEGSPTA